MSDHDTLVQQFYHRIMRWYLIRATVAAITLWVFLWGTAVLALRATQGTPAEWLLWGAVGTPVFVGFAARAALRVMPDRTAVRALLDRHGQCGGLLMTSGEHDLGAWDQRVPKFELPMLRWRAKRPLGLLAVAAGYLALAFLVPTANILANDNPLDVDREAERLAGQVRVLKEEKILDPKRAETLTSTLDEVRSRAAGKDPAKTLEALDHLNDVVRQAARAAAESAARQGTKLGQVQAGAEALQQAGSALDSKATAELMAELSALAQKAAAENEQLQAGLDDDLVAAMASGKFTTEQLSKLAAAACAAKAGGKKTAQKLFDAKLIDADQLKECDGGKCDSKCLAEFLKKNGCKNGLCDAMGRCAGRGGVNEGPGAAELQFGDRSSEDGAKFREEALPPAALAAMKASQTTGVSSAAPRTDPKAGPTTAGALGGAAAGGGSVNATTVLPQHRAAVARYFDRPAK